MHILSSNFARKNLSPGRVVVVNNQNHRNSLGVILQLGPIDSKHSKTSTTSSNPAEKIYTILLVCDKTYELRKMNQDGDESSDNITGTDDLESHLEKFSSRSIFLPPDDSGQIVEEIGALEIEEIVDRMLNIEATKIIENHKKRSIPRFR